MKKHVQTLKNRILGLLYIHLYNRQTFHEKKYTLGYLRILHYLGTHSRNPKYWIMLGSYYHDRRNYDRAIRYLKSAKNSKKAEEFLWECRKERVSAQNGNRYESLLLKSA